MRRVAYEDMSWCRNPTPARGPGIFSLDELRYYIRAFWTDPTYGICQVQGAKTAFIRACDVTASTIKETFLDKSIEFLKDSTQRRISRCVKDVLTGRVIYCSKPRNACEAEGVYQDHPVPPANVKEAPRQIEFQLIQDRFGPRIRRIG